MRGSAAGHARRADGVAYLALECGGRFHEARSPRDVLGPEEQADGLGSSACAATRLRLGG